MFKYKLSDYTFVLNLYTYILVLELPYRIVLLLLQILQ
jgi:hypothetical protein